MPAWWYRPLVATTSTIALGTATYFAINAIRSMLQGPEEIVLVIECSSLDDFMTIAAEIKKHEDDLDVPIRCDFQRVSLLEDDDENEEFGGDLDSKSASGGVERTLSEERERSRSRSPGLSMDPAASFCTAALRLGKVVATVYLVQGGNIEEPLCVIPLPDRRIYRSLPPHAVRKLQCLVQWDDGTQKVPEGAEDLLHAQLSRKMLRKVSERCSVENNSFPPYTHLVAQESPKIACELLLMDLVESGDDYIADSCVAEDLAVKIHSALKNRFRRRASLSPSSPTCSANADGGKLLSILQELEWDGIEVDPETLQIPSAAQIEEQLKTDRLMFANKLNAKCSTGVGSDDDENGALSIGMGTYRYCTEAEFQEVALLLLFPFCSIRVCNLIREICRRALTTFGVKYSEDGHSHSEYAAGTLDVSAFKQMISHLFSHDNPRVLKESVRLFRTMNTTRSGCLSFREFCMWLAKHLSKTSPQHPDTRVATLLMTIRMPFLLWDDEDGRKLWQSTQNECPMTALECGLQQPDTLDH